GQVSDKVSKLGLLFLGYLLTALLTFCYLLVETPTHLFLLQAAMGFALALTNPTHFSLLSRFSLQTEKQGALWGWADGRDKIATGLAVFVGGVIVSAWSFEALFIVMGILQLCATVYIAALFKSEHLL
ncbi:MAG: hypothetical protein RIQ56_571, partial [Candidatus Parcubacteria bacterium]